MFARPVKGQKAKTISYKTAVTDTIKTADVMNAATKKCISIDIHTPVNAHTVKESGKNATYTDCQSANITKSTYYNYKICNSRITRSSKSASNDLRLNELFNQI